MDSDLDSFDILKIYNLRYNSPDTNFKNLASEFLFKTSDQGI